MVALITLAEAKAHLQITDDDHDDEVQQKANEATEEIWNFLTDPDDAWTEADAPDDVKAAIKILLRHRYEHRGEDMQAEDDVWVALRNILRARRDPVLA
jgi:Phage gp6-like head-tail connector protein